MKSTRHHFEDDDGGADGGADWGPGYAISWQRGPVGMVRNGALIEDIVGAAVDRLCHLQSTRSASETFEEAVELLEKAVKVLEKGNKTS